jgi:hypothetical protein
MIGAAALLQKVSPALVALSAMPGFLQRQEHCEKFLDALRMFQASAHLHEGSKDYAGN